MSWSASPKRCAVESPTQAGIQGEDQIRGFVNCMNHTSGLIAATVVAVILVSPVVVQASPRSHPLDEDAALALLERTLKRDGIYAHRISLDCVSYDTEETTDAYFQFVLRENHNGKCGGDPETSPVVDRYRVYRRSDKIRWLERIEDKWQRYDSGKIR